MRLVIAFGLALSSPCMIPAAAAQAGQGRTLLPRAGLVITRSVKLAPGAYRLAAPASLDSAAITIQGNNLTVDLTGVTLLGSDSTADPDQGSGVAIHIEGGRNVRVIGGAIRGYKIGLLATGTRRLALRGLDASHNWKPRLYSLVEHESLADWLSFHQNEKREWTRYGAGIYLEDVKGGEVRDSRVVQGMNGLLLVRTDSLLIRDNTFSFNSGLGIGLYRSSVNTIVRNRLDYNVRGYSHGFYHRGQDSAGLLLYEQSSHNTVAWNSATHGGDGLFLWAGQSTMDSGDAGANDNVFYGNDFSFAPANAMEATFSRNRFLANRAEGSDYGLWGGYSWESVIAGNCFVGNRVGIAIEHGQDNLIAANRFSGDTTAVWLWANPIEPSEWGYPKHRDTRSRDTRVMKNRFEGNRVAVRARTTPGLEVSGNVEVVVDSMLALDDSTRAGLLFPPPERTRAGITGCGPGSALPAAYRKMVPRLPSLPHSVPASDPARLDRSAIVVDEWGPFDWQSPRVWPVDSVRASPLRLRTGGPAGSWRVVNRFGIAEMTPTSGRIGDTITVTPIAPGNDWAIRLEYQAGDTVARSGNPRPQGSPVAFGYSRWEPVLAWDARFFRWDDSLDLRQGPERFDAVTATTPILTRQLSRLDFEWYRPQIAELPLERWALLATTSVELSPGAYQLRTISDDGIRVWVDDRLVLDHWNGHESEVDRVPIEAGAHRLRVGYFQDGGWTELRVEILRRP